MQTQHGNFLFEVLITLTILTLALLGIDAMQIYTLRETKNAYLISIALQQLQNISEALTQNKNIMELSNSWNQENAKVLPNGHGVIEGQLPHVKLSIFWGNTLQSCDKTFVGASGCLMLNL